MFKIWPLDNLAYVYKFTYNYEGVNASWAHIFHEPEQCLQISHMTLFVCNLQHLKDSGVS